MNVPVGVAAGGTMMPISWLTQPSVLSTRNTGTMSTCNGMSSVAKITMNIKLRPGNSNFARANPAIELAIIVIKLLIAATSIELNA